MALSQEGDLTENFGELSLRNNPTYENGETEPTAEYPLNDSKSINVTTKTN